MIVLSRFIDSDFITSPPASPARENPTMIINWQYVMDDLRSFFEKRGP